MAISKPIENPPFNVTRASHVVLRVRDLSASRAFYVDTLGFAVSDDEPGRLWLRGLEEGCHHSLVLEQASGPSCARVGLRVRTDEDLDRALAYFKSEGLPAQEMEVANQGRTIHVNDVTGTPLEFCATMPTRPRLILASSAQRGACPQRLDHFQIGTPRVEQALDAYMAMGFRLSEYIVADGTEDPAIVFLQRKGNPHDIVFASGPGPRLHHAAFLVPESGHLLFTCDQLAEHGFGRSVEFGPGRHFGPGYARFVYVRDPDGHRIELFTTHYQTMDIEDEPIRWDFASLAKVGWGARPPASWFAEASPFTGIEVSAPANGLGLAHMLVQA